MSSPPSVSNSYKTFTVTPSDNLSVKTQFKIRITTAVKDTVGNAMSSNWTTAIGFTSDSWESITEDRKSKLREKISDKVKSIAIYSLTESVLKRVEGILKKILPGIKVHLSHDKGGNNQLESYAKTADIFVIVTSSAKHAATEFIQKNRPKDKTTLFAAGKGSSSIIRALEEQYV